MTGRGDLKQGYQANDSGHGGEQVHQPINRLTESGKQMVTP